jgi:FtsP/CotA-like multicopper oxidase with cupredoxin domain
LLGDTILVNGTAGPYFHATTELIRLRLLNASTARVYNLGFSDGRRFAVIGTDGGLLSAPHPTDRVQLAPGERAEIVVRLASGEKAVLRSYRPELGTIPVMTRISGGLDTFDVLQLRAGSSSRRPTAVPRRLADLSRVDAGSAVVTRSFLLAGRQINGNRMDLQRIDEVVTLDTTEVWEVLNLDAQPHSFHVHDCSSRSPTVRKRSHLRSWTGARTRCSYLPAFRYGSSCTSPTMPILPGHSCTTVTCSSMRTTE